jgi:hypothetical protein
LEALSVRLEAWRQDPASDPELQRIATQAIQTAAESVDYDWAAPTTVQRRALHLAEYQAYVEATKPGNVQMDNDLLWGTSIRAGSQSHLTDVDFLPGPANIERNLRGFLSFMAQALIPRSYSSKSVKLKTITQHRNSMEYWIDRHCSREVSLLP